MRAILKISSPLSNSGFFTAINDQEMSMDAIIRETIKSLQEDGRYHESIQLENLYRDHLLFCEGNMIGKGTLFNQLKPELRTINGEETAFAEISLIKGHVGGI